MSKFLKLWWVLLFIKLAIGISLPLFLDESYYWFWGQHPQWSYIDHPPFVGWLMWLGSKFDFGFSSVRIPGIILGHTSFLFLRSLMQPFLNDDNENWWLAFMCASPLVGLGSLIITPDLPLQFMWIFSMWTLVRCLQKNDLFSYVALGAAMGFGFCAKYHMVLFAPAAFLWLFASGEYKKLRWQYVAATAATGLIFCFPVIYWNWTHDFASFRFQLNHGLAAETRNIKWPLQYLGDQILILFPTVFLLALFQSRRKDLLFWICMGWFPLAFFFLTSFRAHGEANWPAVGHISILCLAFLYRPVHKAIKYTLFIWVTIIALLLSHVALPWLPIPSNSSKLSEFKKYDPLIEIARSEPIVFASSYQMAGALSFHLRRSIFKLGGINRKDIFDFLPESFPKQPKFILFLEPQQTLPDWVRQEYKITSERAIDSFFREVQLERNETNSHL